MTRANSDLPTFTWSDGSKSWYLNGKRHRLTGPAAEIPGRPSRWYINGIEYTDELTYWLAVAEWKKKHESWYHKIKRWFMFALTAYY